MFDPRYRSCSTSAWCALALACTASCAKETVPAPQGTAAATNANSAAIGAVVRASAIVEAGADHVYTLSTTGVEYKAGVLTSLTMGGNVTEGTSSWLASITLDSETIRRTSAQFELHSGDSDDLLATNRMTGRWYTLSRAEANETTTVEVTTLVYGRLPITTKVVFSGGSTASGVDISASIATRGEVQLALALTQLLDPELPADDDPNYTTFKECLDAAREACSQSYGGVMVPETRPCIRSIHWSASPNSCTIECYTAQECRDLR